MDYRLKNGQSIIIHEFKPEDLDGVVGMFQRMSKGALQFGLPPYDRPRLETWVTGLGGGVLLVAFDKADVVGVAMVFGRPHVRFKGIGEFVIYLHQDYHNQGLGTFLTKAILQEARRKGFHRVGLEVVADNSAAIKTYERAGFVTEGRLRHAFRGDDGTYHDQLVMGCIL
jgi:RimJ/RimL family protein N-acetyltransferase